MIGQIITVLMGIKDYSVGFQDKIQKDQITLVKFFSPFCGYSKKFAPKYEQVAIHYEKSSTVVIAEVDCTIAQQVCLDFGVKAYPTLKLFKDGKYSETYKEWKETQNVIDWLNWKLSDEVL